MAPIKKPDFIEYWTDKAGHAHIMNVFCKGCGTTIQEGRIVRNHLRVEVPVLSPTPAYVDMYISFRDKDGVLRRKSTPMCSECAKKDYTAVELEEIHAADNAVMAERHRKSGVKDDNAEARMADRAKMRMVAKIGQCVPGYIIVGEGR